MTNLNILDRERRRRDAQRAASLAEHRAMTVREWCEARRVSVPMFYKLAKQGRAPRSYRVGTRRFISNEADAAWQVQQEAEESTTA